MEQVKVRIKGTRPLLMQSPHKLGQETGRSKAYNGYEDEARDGLYRDGNGSIGVPSLNVLATLRNAAKDFKVPGKGKKNFSSYIMAGIDISPLFIPLDLDGANPDESWQIDIRPVVIKGSRVMKARPRFDNWALNFTMTILDPIIRPEDMNAILDSAGKYVGLLDYRPLFGKFEITKFERVE